MQVISAVESVLDVSNMQHPSHREPQMNIELLKFLMSNHPHIAKILVNESITSSRMITQQEGTLPSTLEDIAKLSAEERVIILQALLQFYHAKQEKMNASIQSLDDVTSNDEAMQGDHQYTSEMSLLG